MKNVTKDIRKTYTLLLEHAYGNSLTNKQMWLDVFEKAGKVPESEKVFTKSERDFGPVTEAENYVQSLGYSIGAMQSDNPRALVKGKCRIAKWWNINQSDYNRIDGLMLSDDYRNGSVVVVLFNDKDEVGDVEKAPEDEGATETDDKKEANAEEVKSETPTPTEKTEQKPTEQPSTQLKLPESTFEKKLEEYNKLINENVTISSGMETSNKVLKAVKSKLGKIKEDKNFYVTPYQNGREHGWHITNNDIDKAVSFSEYRSSDEIVVYFGKWEDFNDGGNIPNDKIYKTKKFFDYDKIEDAADFIVKYLV